MSAAILALSIDHALAEPRPPSVTVRPNGLVATVVVEANVSAGVVLEPWSIAPDVSYGATDRLTLSLVHSTFGTTGFRGGTGRGVCVPDAGCGGGHYNNGGGEALFGLVTGTLAVGAVGGVFVNPGRPTAAHPSEYDAKLGFKSKLTAGSLAVTFNPSLYVAMNDRGRNPELLYLPLGLSYRVTRALTAGLGTGVFSLDLASFADSFTIPAGANATYTIGPRFTVGASFTFAKLTGAAALRDAEPAAVGVDFRGVHAWLTYSR